MPVTFTPRERCIARMLVEGRKKERILQTLRLSPETLQAHLHTMFDATGTENRDEFVNFLYDHQEILKRVNATGMVLPPLEPMTEQEKREMPDAKDASCMDG